jgi:pyruvate-ferredoxin/flavodoxin oxidoreductase
MLRDIAGIETEKPQEENLEEKIRNEVVGNIAQGLMKMAGGNGDGLIKMAMNNPENTGSLPAEDNASNGESMAPWLETDECTSCDECIKINPNIFTYNDDNKAYIKNAKAGPYEDLVKAAEKCTAGVIHPGLPADKLAKDMEKWISRGEKYN